MQVEFQQIHKQFGPVQALCGIDMRVESGTIHGLVGENGAGKSTLMKILTGYLTKTGGRILLDGVEVDCSDPQTAAAQGIGMLYQEPQDFPSLNVLDNFIVGRDSVAGLDRTAQRQRLGKLAERVHFSLHLSAVLEKLTIGERQQLEFLRLLGRDARVLILDEPTTGISDQQKALLFQALRQIRDEGRTIILVSHKLEEVEALCDRVTILRHGLVTGEAEAPFKVAELLSMMFDKPPSIERTEHDYQPGEEILRFSGVSANGERVGLSDCNVTINRGDIVGLAGLSGSGQGVFLRLAAGLLHARVGDLIFSGAALNRLGHREFREKGGVFLPSDRLHEGLIPGFTLRDHFALASGLSSAAAQQAAEQAIQRFHIRGTPETLAESLSGGNQQRLQLALIQANAQLVLLESPTRGLDVESGQKIWRYLRETFSGRGAIVFSSAELDEILAVANRVLVFFDGRVVRDLRADELDYEHIASAMTGK